MEKLNNIVKFLNNYLDIKGIEDTSRNGLQIRGEKDVFKIAFTENASLDTFKKAIKEKVDLIIVHHGIYWKTDFKKDIPCTKERIKLLEEKNISLYAAHLPLDRHKIVGNNAQLLKLLGAKIKKGFDYRKGKNISWIGEFKKPTNIDNIVKVLKNKIKAKCVVLSFGNKNIKTIAACSGGPSSKTFYEAIHKNVDLYLTGESKDIYAMAKDAKFNVIFAGHYATETVGVKALIPVLSKKFKIKTVFIDDPTGL